MSGNQLDVASIYRASDRLLERWLPIETAPREYSPILGAGVHRRADRGDPLVIDIIYWATHTEMREVSLGDNLFRRERCVTWEGWVRHGDVADRPLDFEPDYWMPLPSPPVV